MYNSKFKLSKMDSTALTQLATDLKITLNTKDGVVNETKKSLIEKIMLLNEPQQQPAKAKVNKDGEAVQPKLGKNVLQVRLNGKPLQQFSIAGTNVTTIDRFFAKFGLLADSSKDSLIIEVNGQQIDYFKVRKSINKLISSQFIGVTHNAVYNADLKRYVNDNDSAVKEATAYIRKSVGLSYEHINSFLTMDSADFRQRLSQDQIFAEIVEASPLQPEAKKLITYTA